MSQTPTEKKPTRWFVPYPKDKAQTGHPCQDACRGNRKMGQVLEYFLVRASYELDNQSLPESCNVVMFTFSHVDILKKVNITEKTLIAYLKLFNEWGFILTERYARHCTVQAEPVMEAMIHPPHKPRKTCHSESCNNEKVNFTGLGQDEESCNVVKDLRKLQEKVYLFGKEVEKLQDNPVIGKLYRIALSGWFEAASHALKMDIPITITTNLELLTDSNYVSAVAEDDTHITLSLQQLEQLIDERVQKALQQATNNTPPSKNDNHTTNVEQPQERGIAASSTREEASDDRRDTRHSPSSSDSDSNLVGTVPATGLEMGDRGPQKSIEVGASDDRFDGRDLGASDGIRASNPAKPTRARQPKKVAPPKITFSEQEQQFWQWWCGQWFNVDIPPTLNDTAYAHVQKLAPHIKTSERLDSLIAHTRKELQERGIKRKTVYLGNCVASYSGWKQAAPPPPSPSGYVPQDGVQLVGGKPAADFTEEEIEAIPDAFKRKAIRSIRRSNALTEEEIEAFLQHPPPSSAITKHFAVAR